MSAWLSRVIVAGLLLVPLPAASQEAGTPVDLELVLAVDVSGSVDKVEARLQRQGYVAAMAHPRVIEAIEYGSLGRIAVTYVEWANELHHEVVVDWTLVSDTASAETFAAALSEAPLATARWTSISGAIDNGAGLFEGNGFRGTRRVIDVSGDGYNNRGRPVTGARDDAVARGITINGLPIVNERPNPWGGPPARDLDLYYQDHVIGGPGAFMIVAESFDDFASAILSKLILEIADHEPPEAPDGVRVVAASDAG